ncbi:MAG: lamin tail domain-containing protein [bacterium]
MRPLTTHRGRALAALGLLLALAGCGAPCETGEPCERRCPPGGVGLCAAHGLCACVADPGFDPTAPPAAFDPLDPIGAPGADGVGDPAAGPPSGEAPAACAPATPGALVINELMLDGEPSEDAEFVELVNPGDHPVALAGLSLTSSRGANQVQRVAFTGGCLPPRGALAMFPDRAAWIEAPASPWPIAAEPRSFGFANSADFDFRLSGPDGALIDQLTGPGDAIRPGVSLNRAPDLRGPAVAPHSTVDAAGLSASPGACPNGGRYAEGCAPPPADLIPGDLSPAVDERPSAAALAEPPDADADGADAAPGEMTDAPDAAPPPDCPLPEPGDLVIAEVLVDGAVPRTETDEFVELVNRTPLPRRLHGVGIGYEKQGHVEPRVRFEDGCLPAHGAIVVRPRLDDWIFAPPPAEPITVTRAELALGNETRDPLVVVDADGAVLARFPLAGQPITEGTSLTRHPGLDGDPTSHDRLGPRRSSPGTCPDGRPFGPDDCAAAGLVACRPAEPGELVIDEVLVDGVEPGEADEFVELVNSTDDPLALAGVALLTNRGAEVVERVRFDAGCLAPGALVALYAATERWVWSEPAPGVVADVARFGFANDAPFIAELRRDDLLLDGVRLARSLFAPGISAARAVHADPDAAFVRHDALAATPSSPGRVADEAALEAVR